MEVWLFHDECFMMNEALTVSFFSLNEIRIDPIWGHVIKEDMLGILQSVCDKVQDTHVYFDHMLFFSQFVGLAYKGKDIVFRFIIEY
jgi:hypothetical protein